MYCIIEYIYEGKHHAKFIYPKKGWEADFAIKILNHIEAIVDAGAKITGIERHGI